MFYVLLHVFELPLIKFLILFFDQVKFLVGFFFFLVESCNSLVIQSSDKIYIYFTLLITG